MNNPFNLSNPLSDDLSHMRSLPDDEPQMQALSARFKALSHPMRLAILKALANQEQCCCHTIVETLPLAQSTVSQHLKILKKAGFVSLRIKGQHSWYCVNHEAVKAFLAECQGLFGGMGVCSADLCEGLEYQDCDMSEQQYKYGAEHE